MGFDVTTAAQLIVSKIVLQAEQEGVPLCEVERKMLLFSETSPTPPDMSPVNDAFDRNYDRLEYERKIIKLIRDLRAKERHNPEAHHIWTEAIKSLRGEDYYFLVMLNEACGQEHPRGDSLRLVATAILIVAVFLVIAFFLARR